MNILEKIVAHKRTEVAAAKARKEQRDFERDALFARPTLSLAEALRHAGEPGIIAEFKRQSPSKGVINAQVEPDIVTAGYAAAGAQGCPCSPTRIFSGVPLVILAKPGPLT